MLLLSLLLACRHTPPTGAPAAAQVPDILQGTWVVALTEADEARLKVLEFALASRTPGESELREAGLSESDIETVQQLRALPRDAEPLQIAQDLLARVGGSTLVIGEETMEMVVGARREAVRWALVSQQGTTLTLQLEESGGRTTQGTLLLREDGLLTLVDSSGRELLLERKP